jgi:hypothetical protein
MAWYTNWPTTFWITALSAGIYIITAAVRRTA